jgi:hypothetical protein
MTASTSAEQPFSVVLDDDETTVAEGRLRDMDAGPTWAKHRVTIRLDESDTSGHAASTAVAISLSFDDDVEGHALSLHFPSPEKAEQFRNRLVATGIVAGALVVGVTAAQLSASAPTTSTGPAAAPAPAISQLAGPRGATAPKLSSSHIAAPAVPRGATAPKLATSHIAQTAADSSLTQSQVRDQQRHANKDAAGTSASSGQSEDQVRDQQRHANK